MNQKKKKHLGAIVMYMDDLVKRNSCYTPNAMKTISF